MEKQAQGDLASTLSRSPTNTSSRGTHTAGPWRVREGGNTYHTLGVYGPTVKVCTMNAINSEANARLIAAAPDLVHALKAAVAYVELHTGHGVRQQPPAQYLKASGEFDAEAIARDARAVLDRL